MPPNTKPTHNYVLKLVIVLTLIWSGMIIGISFLESSIKFNAPSLTLPIAMDVGMQVFGVFEKYQWVLLLALSILFYTRTVATPTSLIGLIQVSQLLQSIWLLPILNEQASTIIAGDIVPNTLHHYFFGVLEIFKLTLLIFLAGKALKQLEKNHEQTTKHC